MMATERGAGATNTDAPGTHSPSKFGTEDSAPRHSCATSPEWRVGLRPGDDDTNDHLREQCPACRAEDERAAAIARWEDEPLDPDDDLALIADYPDELARLREAQRRIAADPVFRVVDLIGGDTRAGFLAAVCTAGGLDDAGAVYFAEHVCRCDHGGGLYADGWVAIVGGQPVYRIAGKADRCRWCVLLDVYRDEQHAAVEHATGKLYREHCVGRPETRSERVGRRLREALGAGA